MHSSLLLRWRTASTRTLLARPISVTIRPLSTTPTPDPSTSRKERRSKTKGHEKTSDVSLISTIPSLSKARLSSLVVLTTFFGYISSGLPPSSSSVPLLLTTCFGTALCASSASTINQILEIDRDRKMIRTKNRPLPMGHASPQFAKGLALTTGLTGTALLTSFTNPVTATLGAGNILLYGFGYTLMKPRSEWNTWLGAIVGAIPPVMGWTAATYGSGGSMFDLESVYLGSSLFLWQFPHFFALNWMYREDYKRGGFEMVAVNDERGDRTSSLITNYSLLMTALPFIAVWENLTSEMFLIEGGILNAYLLYTARKFEKERSNGNARKVFLASLGYLPCFMIAFVLHSKCWDEEDEQGQKKKKGNPEGELEMAKKILKEESGACSGSGLDIFPFIINKVRSKGREICLHENKLFNERMEKFCPHLMVMDAKPPPK